jgi:transposase-like protein
MARATLGGRSGAWDEVRHARRWTEEQAEWVLGEWRQSGHSVQRFASDHDLDPQRLYSWRKRLSATASGRGACRAKPDIVELKVDRAALSVEPRRVDIVLVSGRRVSVLESIDASILERIVTVLERGC